MLVSPKSLQPDTIARLDAPLPGGGSFPTSEALPPQHSGRRPAAGRISDPISNPDRAPRESHVCAKNCGLPLISRAEKRKRDENVRPVAIWGGFVEYLE